MKHILAVALIASVAACQTAVADTETAVGELLFERASEQTDRVAIENNTRIVRGLADADAWCRNIFDTPEFAQRVIKEREASGWKTIAATCNGKPLK